MNNGSEFCPNCLSKEREFGILFDVFFGLGIAYVLLNIM
jgi:hypothetical protein